MKVKDESEKAGLKLNIQKTKIMASGPVISWEIDGKQWKQGQTLFWGAPKSLQMVTAAMKLKDAAIFCKSSNNTLKRLYTMTKWALSQGCKDSSISANQSM